MPGQQRRRCAIDPVFDDERPASRKQHDERHARVGDGVDQALLITRESDVGPRTGFPRQRTRLADGDDHEVVLARERCCFGDLVDGGLEEVRAGGHRPGCSGNLCGERVFERARPRAEVLHPGAEVIGARGVRAGQQDALSARRNGQQIIVVLEQHDAAFSGPLRLVERLGRRRGALERSIRVRIVEQPERLLESQNPHHRVVDARGVYRVRLDEGHAVGGEFGPAHDDVEACRE